MEDCEQGICLIRQEPGNEVEREEALNVWSNGCKRMKRITPFCTVFEGCSPMGECPGGEFQVCLPVGQFTRGQCFPREFYNEIGQLVDGSVCLQNMKLSVPDSSPARAPPLPGCKFPALPNINPLPSPSLAL